VTTVAIMQPTFLPWLGYFDLMANVDTFVLLDSVQLSHQSWQHRNRIVTQRGLTWLTVPIAREDRHRRIDACRIGEDRDFPDSLVVRLHDAYRDAPASDLLQPIEQRLGRAAPGDLLVDLNLDLLDDLRSLLNVTTPMVRSSTMGSRGARGGLVLSLCLEVGATTYVTPPGAIGYLADAAESFADAGIEIVVHAYDHPTYDQVGSAFLSHASSVDAIARTGRGAPDVLARGHELWLPLSDHLEAMSHD
jgi:hypothetical protein